MFRKLAGITFAAAALAVAPFFARAEDNPPAGQPAPKATPDTGADTADALYQQIEAAKPPTPDRSKISDPAYVKEARAQMKEIGQRRAELAKRFLEKYPDDSRKVDVLFARADGLGQAGVRDRAFVDATMAFVKAA